MMTEEKFDDVAFLKTPGKWPCYPLCPVKSRETREDGFPRIGFVAAAMPTIVWLANMIAACEGEVDFDAVESKSYPSVEALAADWYVD